MQVPMHFEQYFFQYQNFFLNLIWEIYSYIIKGHNLFYNRKWVPDKIYFRNVILKYSIFWLVMEIWTFLLFY